MEEYTGEKAMMMYYAADRYTVEEVTGNDPWWGERKERRTYAVLGGVTYRVTYDRDGWVVLTKVEG